MSASLGPDSGAERRGGKRAAIDCRLLTRAQCGASSAVEGVISYVRRVSDIPHRAKSRNPKSHRVAMLRRQINPICAPHLASTAN